MRMDTIGDPGGSRPTRLMGAPRRRTVDHNMLSEEAHHLEAAAADLDLNAVHGSLCRLRELLSDHYRSEGAIVAGLDEPSRRLVAEGQQRLTQLIDHMVRVDNRHQCSCLARAGEVAQEITRLVRLETRIIPSHH